MATIFWKPSTPFIRAMNTSAMPPVEITSISSYWPNKVPTAAAVESCSRTGSETRGAAIGEGAAAGGAGAGGDGAAGVGVAGLRLGKPVSSPDSV